MCTFSKAFLVSSILYCLFFSNSLTSCRNYLTVRVGEREIFLGAYSFSNRCCTSLCFRFIRSCCSLYSLRCVSYFWLSSCTEFSFLALYEAALACFLCPPTKRTQSFFSRELFSPLPRSSREIWFSFLLGDWLQPRTSVLELDIQFCCKQSTPQE